MPPLPGRRTIPCITLGCHFPLQVRLVVGKGPVELVVKEAAYPCGPLQSFLSRYVNVLHEALLVLPHRQTVLLVGRKAVLQQLFLVRQVKWQPELVGQQALLQVLAVNCRMDN